MPVRKDQHHWSIAKSMPRIAAFTWATAVLWLITATSAHAASVSYFLDQSNRLPDGTDYLKVTIDDEGQPGAINFQIQALEPLSDIGRDKSGILRFGFNGDELDKSNFLGLPDGWKIKNDKTLDGFGKYENLLIGKKWDGQDPLSFSIVGVDGDSIFSYADSHDGGDGLFFAAFVGGFEGNKHHGHDNWRGHGHGHGYGHDKWYGDDCHRCTKGAYFFAGGTPAPVPVPAAVWLFGSGLAGLLGMTSRRRSKKT